MAEDMNMIAIDTDEGVSITNRGTSFLGKVQSGLAEAEFTKVKVGTGLRPEGTDPMEMTQLVNYKMDGLIKEVGYDEDTNDSYVTLQLKNTAIAENFIMTEAGIYVDDPDIGEILYGYIDFQDKPIPVIARTQGVESFECKLHVYTSNIQNFTAVLSPLSDVPRKEFESEINGLKNPIFDDSGEVEDITDFSSFLTTLVSGMSIFQFFRNLKAGLKFVLNVGMTVNNLESDSTVYPLSAAQGKVLKGMVDKLNAEIQTGTSSIVREANKTVSKEITFPKPFSKEPVVFVSGYTSAIGVYAFTVSNVTTTGFTVYCYANNNDGMGFGWTAISK